MLLLVRKAYKSAGGSLRGGEGRPVPPNFKNNKNKWIKEILCRCIHLGAKDRQVQGCQEHVHLWSLNPSHSSGRVHPHFWIHGFQWRIPGVNKPGINKNCHKSTREGFDSLASSTSGFWLAFGFSLVMERFWDRQCWQLSWAVDQVESAPFSYGRFSAGTRCGALAGQSMESLRVKRHPCPYNPS